jgi:hypothetical protein
MSACQKADGNCFLCLYRSDDCGFIKQGTTMMSEVYFEALKQLHRTIQNKRHGMLPSGVMLLHDNERPHAAARNRALLERFNWELFDYPPHSYDLAPRDYHLYTYLKNLARSHRFKNNVGLMEGVKTLLSSQTADFFDTGIQKFILRYKCLNLVSDCVEK